MCFIIKSNQNYALSTNIASRDDYCGGKGLVFAKKVLILQSLRITIILFFTHSFHTKYIIKYIRG